MFTNDLIKQLGYIRSLESEQSELTAHQPAARSSGPQGQVLQFVL